MFMRILRWGSAMSLLLGRKFHELRYSYFLSAISLARYKIGYLAQGIKSKRSFNLISNFKSLNQSCQQDRGIFLFRRLGIWLLRLCLGLGKLLLRFLRAWFLLAFGPKRRFYFVSLLLLHALSVDRACYAQRSGSAPLLADSLTVGAQVPAALWQQALRVLDDPQGRDSLRLSASAGAELILLDFWATSCGTCLHSLPKTFAQVEPYAERVLLLPVTYQPAEQIERFLARYDFFKSIPTFYTVVDAQWLTALFSVHWYPQLMVLDAQGRLLDRTRPAVVNADYLTRMLALASSRKDIE